MKILLLGASGSIGGAIFKRLASNHDVYGSYNENMPVDATNAQFVRYSLTDSEGILSLLDRVRPELVISSLTGDFEKQIVAHEHIAEYLNETSGRCIYISTANVFDGSPTGSKTENEKPYSISSYGKFKIACEQLLQSKLMDKCLIIRLPRTLNHKSISIEIEQIEKNRSVINNLFMSYNTADNVANALSYCIEKSKHGILHLSSRDSIATSDFVKLMLSSESKDFKYSVIKLTPEEYCKILGCNDISLLHFNIDGNFYLSLDSVDSEIKTQFAISCEEVMT